MTHLTLYTIYDHPKDYPASWVVRRSYVPPATPEAEGFETLMDLHPWATCGSLEEARASVPDGSARLEPHPDDDPVIKEIWL
jgi:hypothetical protein